MKKIFLALLLAILTIGQSQGGVISTNGFFIITNPPQQVSLSWDLSTDPTVVGYNLYFGTNSQQYTQVQTSITNNFATVSNITYSTTYFFALTAYAKNGTNGILESLFSSEVSYNSPSIPNSPVLHKPLKLAVQSRTGVQSLWADTDMYWSFDPSLTNEFFRLKLVSQ